MPCYAVLCRSEHRWYYFVLQRRGEVSVFVHYDSAAAGANCPGVVLHTAFEDPTTPTNATPRQSLETRVLAWIDG